MGFTQYMSVSRIMRQLSTSCGRCTPNSNKKLLKNILMWWHCSEVGFALITQQPRVRTSALLKNFVK